MLKLDQVPYVERYAWFPFKSDDKNGKVSALYNAVGSLAKLGKLYSSLGNIKCTNQLNGCLTGLFCFVEEKK
ncbi:MAG TPA: hypothetical protein DDW50_15420 [Firmicutes bacterium]|jgi:hypothetical protein|nr:hypothetical protein [Bacillota bacterium]